VTFRLPINIVLPENQIVHYFYNTKSIGVYNFIHKVTALSYIQYTSDFDSTFDKILRVRLWSMIFMASIWPATELDYIVNCDSENY